MNLATIPFFERLASSKNILLAGAGGGFDVFAGIPIFAALRKMQKRVVLANLSFSRLDRVTGRRPSEAVVEVLPKSDGPVGYFPERALAEWLQSEGEDARVFAFEKTGVVQMKAAYAALVSELGIDTIVLVDGGTDSLLCGDEVGLGTPSEDMTSLAAVDDTKVDTKMLLSIGFGIDTFHGVCHSHVLESIAALIRANAFHGAFSVLPSMPEYALYKSAVLKAHAQTQGRESIVNSSILSAIEGDFGDVHRTERTRGSELCINPLMGMYFAFDLTAVARRVLYLDQLKTTQSMFEVSAMIEGFQRSYARGLKDWRALPF